MTFDTYRNNVKPMLSSISFVMMVFLGLLWAVMTLEGICLRYFSCLHGIAYCIMSLIPIRMIVAIPFLCVFMLNCFSIFRLTLPVFFGLPVSLVGPFMPCLAFWTVGISFFNNLAVGRFSIRFMAYLAIAGMTIFFRSILVKFRQRLVFFAMGTWFWYSWFSHNQFLNNWLCFEPLQTQYLCGSAYNIGNYLSCQHKNRKNY